MSGRPLEHQLAATQRTVKFFETLLRASADGILITDPSQNIILANETFAGFLGRGLRELKETSLLVWLEPSDPAAAVRWSELERRVRLAGECRGVEFALPVGDGVRHLSVNAALLDLVDCEESGTIVSTWRDISERRRLEERARHAEKTESLAVLAGGVAHDFNNLLTGILGHGDLALAKLPAASAARGHIEELVQAAEQAAGLSGKMLAYSGHGNFVVRRADLNVLVRESLHLLETTVPDHVRLETRLSGTPAMVRADSGQLQQLVMSLVQNGVEAIGDGRGVVTLTTGSETISDGGGHYSPFTATDIAAGRYVFLEVRDDGCGMDEATLARAFDPFFSTKFVGRGLGLAAVLGIVRGHKGGIQIDSAPGLGTGFKVLFREADPDQAARPQEG